MLYTAITELGMLPLHSEEGRIKLEFPEFLSTDSCKYLIGNVFKEKGSGSNEIISKHFHCSFQKEHIERLLRQSQRLPRNDRKMAFLLDLSLRA
jgi:hypothetical protein